MVGWPKTFGSVDEGYVGFDLSGITVILEPEEIDEFECGRYLGFSVSIENLGHHRLDSRHQIQLVRIGKRVLVLGSSAERLETLSEISEPEEVALLMAQSDTRSHPPVNQSFGHLLEQYRSGTGGRTKPEDCSLSERVSNESSEPGKLRQAGGLHRHA